MLGTNPKRQSVENHTQNPNYKQLYQECKKNVAIFMKKVDNEISTILNNHEKQKKKLKLEIQSLKDQLRQQKQSSFATTRNLSIISFTNNKHGSSLHNKSSTSVGKDVVEQCLSKFAGLELKSQGSERKITTESRIISKKPSLKQYDCQKQNSFLPTNLATINNELPTMPLKSLTNIPDRSKRFREKKRSSTIEVDSVKDVLKNMRDKAQNQTIDYFRYKQNENTDPLVKIVSPEMFSARSRKN